MKKRKSDTYNWRVTPEMLHALPLSKKDRRLRNLILQNVVTMILGMAAIAGLVLAAAYFLSNEAIGPPAAVVLFLVIPICLTLILLNLLKMLGIRYLVITPTTVSYRRRRLGIVTADWTEPLDAYEGIRGVTVRTGKESLEQRIELVHKHPDKTVRFFTKKLSTDRMRIQAQLSLNEALARYAGALRLPVLVADDQGNFTAVPPEHLVKPVGQLIREGVLEVTGWEETPPGGLQVTDTPEGKQITFPPRRRKGILALEGFLVVLFIAAHFMVQAGLEPNEDAMSPLALSGLCAAALAWELFVGRRLYVTAKSLHKMPVVFGMEWRFRERTLSLSEVRSVTIPEDLNLESGPGDKLEAYVASLFRNRKTTSPAPTQALDLIKEAQFSRVIIAAPGKTWILTTECPEHARWIHGLILTLAARG